MVESPLESRDELGQRHAKRDANTPQFSYVKAPFPSLHLADERLINIQSHCEFDLGDSALVTQVPKDLDKNGVLAVVEGVWHHAR